MLYFCIRFWAFSDDPRKKDLTNGLVNAAIAQLVEHDLAKVGVASSSLVCRSILKIITKQLVTKTWLLFLYMNR